jgi:hypothetical protein
MIHQIFILFHPVLFLLCFSVGLKGLNIAMVSVLELGFILIMFFLYSIHFFLSYPLGLKRLLIHGYLYFSLSAGIILSGEIFRNYFQVNPNLDLLLYGFRNISLLFPEIKAAIFNIGMTWIFILVFVFFLQGYFTYKQRNLDQRGLESPSLGLFYWVNFLFVFSFLALIYGAFSKDKAKTGNLKDISVNPLVNSPYQSDKNIIIFILEGVSRESFHLVPQEFLKGWMEVPMFYIPIPHSTSSIFSLLTGNIPDWRTTPDFKTIPSQNHFLSLYTDKEIRFMFSGEKKFENLDQLLGHFSIPIYDKNYIQRTLPESYSSFLWGLDDRSLRDLHEYLLNDTKGTYLHIIYFTNTHSPYFLANRKFLKSRNEDNAKERYLSVIDYNLFIIHEIIQISERKSKGKNIYILTSDHGESFGEYGFYKHGFSLHDTETRVPFFALFPEDFGNNTFSQGTILDIFPTLMDLEGRKVQFPNQGKSMLDPDYELSLPLHSWGSPEYEGKIEKGKKWIRNKRSGKEVIEELK